MSRTVTENDFRMPEFKDAKVEDYEFRSDGKLVRKDRWERGMRDIAALLHISRNFEIDDVVSQVNELTYTKRLFIKALSIMDDIQINTSESQVEAIETLKEFANLHAEKYYSTED